MMYHSYSRSGHLPGPTMTAFHSMMFSGFGNAEIPSGTSVFRRLRSLTSRRRALVDWWKVNVSDSNNERSMQRPQEVDQESCVPWLNEEGRRAFTGK